MAGPDSPSGRRFQLRQHSAHLATFGLSRRRAAEKRWPFSEIRSSPRPHQSDFACSAIASKNTVPFRVSFVRFVIFEKNFGEECPLRGSPYALQSDALGRRTAVDERIGGFLISCFRFFDFMSLVEWRGASAPGIARGVANAPSGNRAVRTVKDPGDHEAFAKDLTLLPSQIRSHIDANPATIYPSYG
jgi:hypothetical protein